MRSKFQTTEGRAAGLPEAVLVGTILRPHGIKGEVTVALWSDYDRRFAPGVELAASSPAARPAAPRRERVLRVERSSPYKGGLRVAFAGIADREAAEGLRGLELWVPIGEVPDPPAGSYYVFELIGCRCFDERDGEIGTVVDVQEDGGYAVRAAADCVVLGAERCGHRGLPVALVEFRIVEGDGEGAQTAGSQPRGERGDR